MINIPLRQHCRISRLSGYYEQLPGYINDPSLSERKISIAAIATVRMHRCWSTSLTTFRYD